MLAAARPEQADHERQRQAEDGEAGDEKERAGGMFHVVRMVPAGQVQMASWAGLRQYPLYCTVLTLTLH